MIKKTDLRLFLLVAIIALSGIDVHAEQLPKSYDCHRVKKPLTIDGKLDDPAWKKAPWTDDFVDIEGDAKPKPRFRTRMKMLWDATYLYVGAELEEPDIKANLTQHDSVIVTSARILMLITILMVDTFLPTS